MHKWCGQKETEGEGERDTWWKKKQRFAIQGICIAKASYHFGHWHPRSFIHSFIQNCSSIMKSKSKFKLINILSTFERPSAGTRVQIISIRAEYFAWFMSFFSHFVCNSMCMLLEQLISIQNAIVNKLKLYGYGNLHFHRSITLFFDTCTFVVDNLLVCVWECASGSRG